jgi:hypothetical protein
MPNNLITHTNLTPEESAARIKQLEFELGMLKIARRHTQTLLASCEKALHERDYPTEKD